MTEILETLRQFGLPTVIVAVLIYLVLRGDFVFRYPARRKRDR
jgi:hypothetical protein